jgi:hypothetical protein
MTRLFSSILLVTTFSLSCATLAAQQSAPAQPSPAAILHPGPPLPSAILQPALDTLRQNLATLRPEKWKISGDTSQQTRSNLSSIQTDLQTTLPGLLAEADQRPDSAVQLFPAYRNIEALYDVLLRVTQVANLSAPSLQIGALQDSMEQLDKSRRELGDRLQASALRQEQQGQDLQAQLHTLQSAPPPPPCPPPPAPAPVKKRKPRPKPAVAPAAPQAATPAH